MNKTVTYAALTSLGAAIFGFLGACGDDKSTFDDDETGAGAAGASTGDGGGDLLLIGGNGGSGAGGSSSCANVEIEAKTEPRPADIIFMIDNSGSMGDEIDAVETNISLNFADIINKSGVDYQVIMVTDHGSNGTDVCIGPPLSNTSNCSGPPVEVAGQFYHYDLHTESYDSLCLAIDSLYGGFPAQNSLAHAGGWESLLRPEAVKIFVEITDDRLNCTSTQLGTSTKLDGSTNNGKDAALAFDKLIRNASPKNFEKKNGDRNYVFFSIVGLEAKTDLKPYQAFENIQPATCPGAVNPGVGYQQLSKGTGATRFSVCATSYDAVFQDMAAGVIDVTTVPCEFDLPDAPSGQSLNLDSLEVVYRPGGTGAPQTFNKVIDAAACTAGSFFVADGKIHLCDASCALVEADSDAALKVNVRCGFIPD